MNKLWVSSFRFPNFLFIQSQHFLTVVKKLFWSCSKDKTRFGLKRNGLLDLYPGLCEFYDAFFYTNAELAEAFTMHDNLLKRAFMDGDDSILGNSTLFKSLEELENQLDGVSRVQFRGFKSLVLSYCQDNLVKLNVHLPSPYITVYRTDQVGLSSKISLHCSEKNYGGKFV